MEFWIKISGENREFSENSFFKVSPWVNKNILFAQLIYMYIYIYLCIFIYIVLASIFYLENININTFSNFFKGRMYE